MLTGIDVSHYDPDLDYARAHREGAAFIVHKASEGTSTDPAYTRRAPAIRTSGAVPGAYHFLRSSPSAAEQVAHFLSVIGDPAGLLIQLDWEISGSDLAPISMARAWVAEWRRRTGDHPVLVYLPRWVWADHLGSPPGLSTLGPLWASRYLAEPPATASIADAARVPTTWWAGYGGWPAPTVLQYAGEAGRIAGTGPADLNLFDGTLADLAVLARTPTPPEDDMPFSCTNHQIPAGFAFDATQKLADRSRVLVLGVPLGGLTGLTRGWLSLSADFGQALIRVAVGGRTPDGHAAWAVQLVAVEAGKTRIPIGLPSTCDKVSVGRVPLTDTDADFSTPVTATLELSS
jgi:GH25 family lysozyme M1 (1,4-beta-N-acetylmuramidase)